MPDALFTLTLEPLLLIDAQQQLLRCTPSARALLARDPALLAQLLARLRGPAPRAAARAFAMPRPGRLPLTWRAAPWGERATLVLLRDPEAVQVDPALLRQLFGLTAAEARVAAALARGCSTRRVAEQMRVQPNTVLAHVKRLLQKTDTQDRTQLVALLLRSAAAVDRSGLAEQVPPVRGGSGG
jgi:DNA-binding CsgD family transcriptional regulator